MTMKTTKRLIAEHDVVTPRETLGSWAAGVVGAVRSVYDDGTCLVELAAPNGSTAELVRVSAALLDVVRH